MIKNRLLLFSIFGAISTIFNLNAEGFERSKCLAALVAHQHYPSTQAAEADPFVQRQITELTRFTEGSTDAPHMTAEFIPEFGTYRIAPRNQTPIQKAKMIFIAIHGNGGGNSGPHSLTGILTRIQQLGIMREGEESQIYVEAPALPGAEAGPNRDNYQEPQQVAQWLARYIKTLVNQNPEAKFVDFTRSSGFDFAFKAHLKDALENEGLSIADDLIGMSPTSTGTTPESHARIDAAMKGAVADLSTNGSGVNHSAFNWIMRMITHSTSWTVDEFKRFKNLWIPTGSKDKQVPLEEREFYSELIRNSGENAQVTDFLGAHHDVFAPKDGYDPEAQAWPMLEARIKAHLGIENPDEKLTPEVFEGIPSKELGNQKRLLTDIHPGPKAQEAAFEAGYRYQASEIHVVTSSEAAIKHFDEREHTNPAIYIIGQNEFAKPFRQVGSIPGFSSFRPTGRVPDFSSIAQSGRLKIKKSDGSIETVAAHTFKTRDIVNLNEIKEIAQEGRLVQRIVMRKEGFPEEIFHVGITPSNIEHYRTWIKLEGNAKTDFVKTHSPQTNRGEDTTGKRFAPETNDHFFINLERAAANGNIVVLPKDMHYSSTSGEAIEANANAVYASRFDPIYFENYDAILEAAEKGKLFEESKPNKDGVKSIRYISPDAVREFVAQALVNKIKAQPKIWSVIETALNAEKASKPNNGNVLLLQKDEAGKTTATPMNASEITNFISDSKEARLVFNNDIHSPASLVFHGWVKPIKRHVFKEIDIARYPFLKKELDDKSLSMTKDTSFWTIMNAASQELDEAGRPMYDVHSWLLPQVLYHQRLGHSIEIVDETGKLVGGAILLNKGDQWSIDCLVDLRTKSEGLAPATNAKDSIVLQNALAEAVNFAFENGAKNVDLERISGQIHSLLHNDIVE